MNYFLKEQLQIIATEADIQEKSATRIKEAIREILLFECGAEYYKRTRQEERSRSPITMPQLNHESNEFQNVVSTKTIKEIIKEIEEMIIELKIKGSVREHRKGLLKFTSSQIDCVVYGRTKEEIEKKVKEKIKQFNKNKGKQDKPES